MRALALGGNAVDAAIATNAAIAVTGPHLCGMGGDLFALVHHHGDVHALNSTGRAGSRRRRSGPPSTRSNRDAVPARHPGRHRARMRRRLGRTARTLRHAANGGPAATGGRSRQGWLPRQPAAGRRRPSRRRGRPCRTSPSSSIRQRIPAPGSGALALPEPCETSPRAGEPRSTRASSATGCAPSEMGSSPSPTSPAHRRIGSSRCIASAFGVDLWTMPPNSQGYLALGAAALCRRTRPARPSPTMSALAHLLIEAATAAGFDRPDVLSDTADGSELLGNIAGRLGLIDAERASDRWSPGRRGDTTYLCVIDGERDGRVADPVQRRRLRLGAGGAEHGDQPAQSGPRVQSAATGTRPSSGPVAARRTPCARPWPRRARCCERCSGRWAATPSRRSSCSWRRGCSATGNRRAWRSTPVAGRCRGRSLGSTPGRAARTDGHRSRARRRTSGLQDLPREGTTSESLPAFDSGFGHAHAIVIDDDGFRVGAADPRTVVGSAAGCDRSTIRTCASTRTSSAPCRCRTRAIRSVASTARRFGNDAVVECYKNLVELGQDRRSTRLRHDVAHRAPLPVRGLRGAAQPDPVRAAPGDAHQGPAPRADVQRRPAVAPVAAGRGLRHRRHPHRWPDGVRRRPWHGATRSMGVGHRGGQRRQRHVCRARPHQPRDLRGVDGGHQAGLVPGAVQLPRQAHACSRPTTCPTGARWSTT